MYTKFIVNSKVLNFEDLCTPTRNLHVGLATQYSIHVTHVILEYQAFLTGFTAAALV